jgi:hypothetical protein
MTVGNDTNALADENTDRELYRDDYRDYSVHVTVGGGIGFNVGGHVIVKPINEWHALAHRACSMPSEALARIIAQADFIWGLGEQGVMACSPELAGKAFDEAWRDASSSTRQKFQHIAEVVAARLNTDQPTYAMGEVERLRAALEPFAEVARGNKLNPTPEEWQRASAVHTNTARLTSG